MRVDVKHWMVAVVLLGVPLGMLPGLWHTAHDVDRFRGDESGWITAADYYTRLIVRGEGTDWDPQPEFGAWGSMTPALGKLLLGTALPDGPPVRAFYRFDQTHEWNEANGHVPPLDMRARVRRLSAVVATIGVALFGWLVLVWRGLGVALGAQLLVATNPLVRDFSASATPDLLAITGTLAIAVLCIVAASWNGRRFVALAAAIGAAVGATAAIKLNYASAALLLPTTLAAGAARGIRTRVLMIGLVVFGVAGALVHVAADPYLWHPEARPGFWSEGDPAWQTTPPGRLALRVADWRRLIDRQGEKAFPPGMGGVPARLDGLVARATGSAHGVPLDVPFALLGLGSLAVITRRRAQAPDQAMAAFVIVQGIVAVLVIPLGFGRYFLPPLLPLAALTAEGVRVTILGGRKLANGIGRRSATTG